MLSANLPAIIEPRFNRAFDGVYKERDMQWEKVYDRGNPIDRSVHEEPVLFGFGNGQLKPTGAAIEEDEGGQAYISRYIYETYGLSFSITQELIEDGEHIQVGTLYAKHLGQSMRSTQELIAANYLNFGFTSLASNGSTVGDGVPLFSSVHPLASGATESNILSIPANLSEAALEQLTIQIDSFVNQRGLFMDVSPQKLIISPSNLYVAERLLSSVLRPGSTNNDINAINALNRFSEGFQVISRLTNAQQWMIKTDIEQGLQYLERRKINRKMEPDFRTGNLQYKSDMRFAFGCTDWAGIWGSAGQ
jgi:hypothetical protein